jgi:hypothetical protein
MCRVSPHARCIPSRCVRFGPGENAATAAAVRGIDAALTRRWLCYCRGRDKVPRSLWLITQQLLDLKLGEGSVPTPEYIVWNNKTFRNKSDCKFHQMPEGFQPPPPVVITNRTTVNTYLAHQGFNFNNSESKSLFTKAPSSLLSYRKQVKACILEVQCSSRIISAI